MQTLSLMVLQARLELAPRVNPDWILSPTRLPIPPLERNLFNFQNTTAESVDLSTSPLLGRYSIFLVGRVPLERNLFNFQNTTAESVDLSTSPLLGRYSIFLVGRVPLERNLFNFQLNHLLI